MVQETLSRVALITGANKGIGLEIARQLGRQGITVLIGARHPDRGREAVNLLRGEQIDARLQRLDVTDEATIQDAARIIEREFGKLDILVNNAGVVIERAAPSETSTEALRASFETNFFGPFALIKAMLPLLGKSEGGRIVNLSSGWASLTRQSSPHWGSHRACILAYSASKTALNALTVLFARELKETKIKVNSADPGHTATDATGHTGQSVAEGARTPVWLATLPEDGPTGGFFSNEGTIPW